MTTTANRARLDLLVQTVSLDGKIEVLDIGANPIEGEVSYQALLDSGYANVTGFEPQEEALAALEARKSDAETYLPHALGDGKKKTLHLYQSTGFTSIFPADPASAAYLHFEKGMTETAAVDMPTRRLDSLKPVGKVDFLKIDVQGSETAIISNGVKKLSGAMVVQTEVRMFPLYLGEPRYGELEAELVAQGFEFLRFATLKHASLAKGFKRRLKRAQFAQAVDGDAFFLRNMRLVNSYSDDQMRKLAVIADSIMGNYDLTLYALEQLQSRGLIDGAQIERYFDMVPADARRDL